MESTGVYWIPLLQILEAAGLEVFLVNARHVKNVPGRKTDVADCQWLQYVHSVGLLKASFRPAQEICAIRSLLRHRDSLVGLASQHVLHMQKALGQMNLQLHHVISDITGVTGLAIIDAVIAGERDTTKLAALRNPRIHTTKEIIAKLLVGDYRPEHIFALQQSVRSFRVYQEQMAACELGPDLSKFRSAAAFSSWMGLPPNNEVSGGKILRAGTRHVKNRVAVALRMSAQSLQASQSALGAFYRRMRGLGGAQGDYSCSPQIGPNHLSHDHQARGV